MTTKQETFDTAALHILKQGERAVADVEGKPKCMYRTPEGLKCAVGALIPDNLYDKAHEGLPVCECPRLKRLMKKLGHDFKLVCQLQNVHDINFPSNWRSALSWVAKQHNLNDDKVWLPEFDHFDMPPFPRGKILRQSGKG